MSSLIVTTRRDGVVLIPDADTATDPCTYTVGASAPETGLVPEVPCAALVPVAAVVVLGGLLYRRRRFAA